MNAISAHLISVSLGYGTGRGTGARGGKSLNTCPIDNCVFLVVSAMKTSPTVQNSKTANVANMRLTTRNGVGLAISAAVLGVCL